MNKDNNFLITSLLSPQFTEEVLEEKSPLTLDLDDETTCDIVDDWIRDFDSFASSINLAERQDKNKKYYIGEQLADINIPSYSNPYMENIIFEAITRSKPIALSRLPDLIISPGNNEEDSKLVAEKLTDIANTDIRKRENRELFGLAYKQRPIYFYAVVKAVWDNEQGDYKFVNVHPQNVIFDYTNKNSRVDDMQYFGENIEVTVKDVIMKFPKKEKELLDRLRFEKRFKKGDENKEHKLATKIKIWEIWFHWYKKTSDELGNNKWERIDGVLWKYKDVILGKMKNPYWDWVGDSLLFDPTISDEHGKTEDDIYSALFGDQEESKKVYNNFFKRPKKPYFLMTYHRWGESPIDVTSEVEQVLNFQDTINNTGRMITDMNSRSMGKDVFSTDGLDKDTIENLDLRNWTQAVKVKGDVRSVHTHINFSPAPPQLVNSMTSDRSKGFEMLNLNATTRGTRETGDETATGRQMMREQDFGAIDDTVEETINPCAEWMVQWAMHFIKLFYTTPKYRELAGKDGDTIQEAISQDLVSDGLIIKVSASGVDKQQRKRQAEHDMQLGMSDPLTYFEDMGHNNPKTRAARVMTLKGSPQLYMQTYLGDEMMKTQEATAQAAGSLPGGEQEGAQGAEAATGAAPPGQEAAPPPM